MRKGQFSDVGNTATNINIGQSGAVIEHAATHGNNAVGYRDARQLSARLEGTVSNAGDAATNCEVGQTGA